MSSSEHYLFEELAPPPLSERARAKDTSCWYAGGCWQRAQKKHLCAEHMWAGQDWTRETVEREDGTSFTYLALRVRPEPSYVSGADLERAALEEQGLKAER